jgi:predicted ATP-dependent endonuclease of OLD family
MPTAFLGFSCAGLVQETAEARAAMIRTVHIENFRGLRDVHITGAQRINVLVGPNGTGKTAFLEALYLACGNSPELLLRTRQWRGREGRFQGEQSRALPAIFGEVFWRDLSPRITIQSESGNRSIEIERTEVLQSVTLSGEESKATSGLIFRYSDESAEENVVPTFDGNKITIPTSKIQPIASNFIAARVNMSEEEAARHLSSLRIENRDTEFIKAIQTEFPMISDLTPEAPQGSLAIYAKMVGIDKKLPLANISGGINYLAGVLVRLAAVRNQVMMIDEIENGLYYDRYRSMWRALHNLSVTNDSQVFATTHSIECLKALEEALTDHPDSIRFLRCRFENGEVRIEQLAGDTLFKALEIGDVR